MGQQLMSLLYGCRPYACSTILLYHTLLVTTSLVTCTLCCCKQKEVREEDRRYREYLRQMREEERRRELEMEKVCDAEVEKMWERRVRQWKMEKMARQKLLEEVLESRRQQIQQKCTCIKRLTIVLLDFHVSVLCVCLFCVLCVFTIAASWRNKVYINDYVQWR